MSIILNSQILEKFNQQIARQKLILKSLNLYKFDPIIIDLMSKIQNDLNVNCGKNMYIKESCSLLNEYMHLLKQPIKTGYNCKTTERKRIIQLKYLEIVSNLIRNKKWIEDFNIKNTNEFTEYMCGTCKNTDSNQIETDEFGKKICTLCSCEIQILEIGNTHLDYNRASIVGKFIYNRVLHFQDCIKQFQGKQNCKIPPCVYRDLDVKFNQYRLLIDSDNPKVKYSKISKEHIMNFLKELKYVKHYENVKVIYSTLTNNTVDDIGHLEQQLIEDFKELVSLYDNLHGKDKSNELERKNFLNVQYLLFQLLRRHGYNCKIEQFSILKTFDRKLFHDKVCLNLFQQLGWNFTPTF